MSNPITDLSPPVQELLQKLTADNESLRRQVVNLQKYTTAIEHSNIKLCLRIAKLEKENENK